MGEVIALSALRAQLPHLAAARGPTCFFDLADPATYLAVERLERLVGEVAWVPTPLGALVGPGAAAARLTTGRGPVEARALALGLPLVWPERHPAPVRAAMRVAGYAAEAGRGGPFVLAAVRLAFCGGFDLDDPEVLAEAAGAAGLGLRESLAAAGDAGRDAGMERAAARLRRAGADRLPALRVRRRLFCGEERVAEAAAAPARRR